MKIGEIERGLGGFGPRCRLLDPGNSLFSVAIYYFEIVDLGIHPLYF
jgi:hypothetical protein